MSLYNLYWEYRDYADFLLLLICLFLIYRLVKVELMLFSIGYFRADSKAGFLARRALRIVPFTIAIAVLAAAWHYGSAFSTHLDERANREIVENGTPNRMYCLVKVRPYFSENEFIARYYTPIYYEKCLDLASRVQVKKFCDKVEDRTAYRSACADHKLSADQCDILQPVADEHCLGNL